MIVGKYEKILRFPCHLSGGDLWVNLLLGKLFVYCAHLNVLNVQNDLQLYTWAQHLKFIICFLFLLFGHRKDLLH